MYNKSEIMKAAWSTYRATDKGSIKFRKAAGIDTFAAALRWEWSKAKSAVAHAARLATGIGHYNVAELNIGDTIEVPTALGVGFTTNKVIVAIAPAPLGFAGKAVSFTDGDSAVFPTLGTIKRLAIAA